MMVMSSWLSLFKSDRTSDTPRIFIVGCRFYSVCTQMAGQGKRQKYEGAELLLHTGGISMNGLGRIMKVVKDLRLTKDNAYSIDQLADANAARSAVMFEHMQHVGTNVFNTSHNHVIHC
jgi:hypothetical protein